MFRILHNSTTNGWKTIAIMRGLIVSRQRPIGEVVRGLLHLARSLEAEDMLDRPEYLSNG